MKERLGERILIVDDEPQMRRLLSVALRSHGYRAETAGTGEEAIERLQTAPFDLLLLDLGLPDLDGLEVCRHVRNWSDIPIIIISVREGEQDKITALDLGADDYVTKPFSLDELLARMRASLRRRPNTPGEAAVTIGPLTLDLVKRRVTRDGNEVHLTPTEYELLKTLVSNRGRVMTHRQLLRGARGPAYEEDTPLLRVHLVGLRRKLSVPPHTSGYIETEPGVGYRLLD